ncbi:hypothetical protein [Nonomuraea sp. NPDC050310]|uniref:hypothetical protein n=1 Tax=Nonomuraea sp. NPDC050310 TaxID=3154935 RepID=UPI0033FE7004
MRHTESDLRDLLAEQVETRGEPAANLAAIVRRGRRLRRTRRVVTAGAALAAAVVAVGLTTGLPGGPPEPDGTTVAQAPGPTRVHPGPKVPDSYTVVLGAERFRLPLLHSERFATTGAGRAVTFTPVSFSTAFRVFCADPQAWVVTEMQLKGGEPGGTAGRCGKGAGGHHDRRSAPTGWLEGPQTIRVWVYPADAPVRKVAETVTGCPPVGGGPGGCDEPAQARSLLRPEVRDRLSAEVGEAPGGWAVALYDRPEPTPAD